MNLREHIDQQLDIQPAPHHADMVLLHTPVDEIEISVIKVDMDRMIRVIHAANEIHSRSLMAACMTGANVIIPEAAVSPRVIGGEAAGLQGGQRAALGLMRIMTTEGTAVGPINAPDDASALRTGRIPSAGRAAILSL